MLQTLYIENIAVIEKVNVEFSSGLNVMTGETGAGKSILIDSINAALGGRTSKELIRTGEEKAVIAMTCVNLSDESLKLIDELGYEVESDGTLLIQRTIKADGKNMCRINGMPATVSVLKALGTHLINIHGQHDNQTLLSQEKHIKYIDKLAGTASLLNELHSLFEEINGVEREMERINESIAEKEQRIDLLTYQINELEAACIVDGEMDELLERRTVYLNYEKLAEALNSAYEALNGSEESDGARELVSSASSYVETALKYYQGLEEVSERLSDMVYELEDCTEIVRESLQGLEYNVGELDEIEERLDLLNRLSRKYGKTESDMLNFLENAKRELEVIEFSEENLDKLKKKHVGLMENAGKIADEISALRRRELKRFERRVTEELTFLDMPKVVFSAKRTQKPLSSDGIDRIEFLISVNPGEELKPLSKIASGGELSRIMLAIKNVIAENDDVDTLIFDEIDTGVSGSAAQKIGQKLREAAKSRQVICITHLAQIAAQAEHHLLIKKNIDANRTYTSVESLDFEGRTREVARIMGGVEITPLTLQNAEEMIRKCM